MFFAAVLLPIFVLIVNGQPLLTDKVRLFKSFCSLRISLCFASYNCDRCIKPQKL